MLLNLHVKNLALIDEIEIEFEEGLNILTGETGAGKSVLIGSINLALGDKADASLIRDGADYALIEMVFQADDELLDKLHAMDIAPEENNLIILQRKIMKNRSVCKVCGETVTLRQLRELSGLLITIHGQNDQLSLLSAAHQMQIIDAFDASNIGDLKRALAAKWNTYLEEKRLYEKTNIDEHTRLKEIDLLAYELSEIEDAHLSPGEDEQLEADFRKYSQTEKIASFLSEADRLLKGDNASISDLTGEAVRLTGNAARLDESLETVVSTLKDLEQLAEDVSRTVSSYLLNIGTEEGRMDEISDRLNLVNRLKEKYAGGTDRLEEVLAYAEKKSAELEHLKDLESYREQAFKQMEKSHAEALDLANRLSALRAKAASRLAPAMETALKDLNFENVIFDIQIESDPAHLTGEGADELSFMISLNPGEKPRPLHKVSSGGELSRIMLALKTVFLAENETKSMIFDEIDAGISGKTAWRVSQKLGELARVRQVICITHLAQIAAMADTHFEIYKDTASGRSVTHMKKLTEEETVGELARLIGTDDVSGSTLSAAAKMRAEALSFRKV